MGARAVAETAAQVPPVAETRASPAPSPSPGRTAAGLAALLVETAHAHPQRTVLRDAGNRAAWCRRPAITWTYAAAAEIVGRLARGLGAWRLSAGSRIGVWFSGGAEAALAHLAVEAAGHLPCLMPAGWGAEALSAGIEAAGLDAVLTEGQRGGRRPAEELALAAVRHFGLRYLAAFGPGIPDGVISLDAMALERGAAAPTPSLGLVTFAGGDPGRPVYRTAAALAAAVAAHLDALPVTGSERILTLLPPHDLRGLVTGLAAALAGGAALESLIPFEEAAFRASLARPVPTRLVIPALVEPALAGLALPRTVRALDVVHRAPARLAGRPGPDPAGPLRLDALALDEDAVLTRPRGPADLAAALALPEHADWPRPLLALARAADGHLLVRGPACAAAPLGRNAPVGPDPAAWRDSRYRPTLTGGTVTGVAPA